MNAAKLALVAAAVLVGALASGWPVLDRLFYVLAGLGLLALGLSLISLRGLRVTRRAATHRGQVGQIFSERLRLENASRLGKLWVEIEDRSTLPGHQASLVTALAGLGAREWTVSTRLTRRGRFQLGPLRLRSGDPFGLFPVQRAVRGTVDLLVYPAVAPLPSVALPAGDLPGDSHTHHRTPHVTPNVGGLRDYAPGDGLNRIAWGPTARFGRLIVKEFELDPTADIWLVLDMERAVHHTSTESRPTHAALVESWRSSTEEFSVVVAASLGVHFLEHKRAVGLLAAGQHHEVIPTDRGPRQMVKLLEALAVIAAAGGAGLGEVLTAEAARFSRHSTLLIVTPATDERWTPALATLTRAGIRASVVLIDASTFGGPESPLLLVGQLAALRVPTFVLNRNDDLSLALQQAGGGTGGGAPRWRVREGI